MTSTQKIDLLTRSLWSYAEVKEYLGIKNAYQWRDLIGRVNPSGFSRKIYRDEIMRVTGTTVEREIEILKGVRNGK